MIALMKEHTMSRDWADRRESRCGLYGNDDDSDQPETVRCLLNIGRCRVPVEIPRQDLQAHHSEGFGEVSLSVPGRKSQRVRETRALTPSEQRWADTWIAEMESFDGF